MPDWRFRYRLDHCQDYRMPSVLATASTLDELMSSLLSQALLLNGAHAAGYLVAYIQEEDWEYEFKRYSLQA